MQEYYDNTDIINPVKNIYTSNILDISNEETNKFDAVISVAVIHHLDTEEKRILSIKECLRVLKPKGLFMFQVWSYEQDHDSKFKFNIGDNNVEWKVLKHQITKDTNKRDKNDIQEVHNRYYYIHNEELLKNNSFALKDPNGNYYESPVKIPLKCDTVYPLYLAKKDFDYAKTNKINNYNKFRCAYSKTCGIPWTEAGCY